MIALYTVLVVGNDELTKLAMESDTMLMMQVVVTSSLAILAMIIFKRPRVKKFRPRLQHMDNVSVEVVTPTISSVNTGYTLPPWERSRKDSTEEAFVAHSGGGSAAET